MPCALAGGSVGGIERGFATEILATGDEPEALEGAVDGVVDVAGGAKGDLGDEGERALTGVAPGDDPFPGPSLLMGAAVVSGRDGSFGLALAC